MLGVFMALTNTQVSKSKPLKKPYKLTDGGGMYLLISPTGSKYWRLKYRLHGKEKTFAIGVFPKVSLAEAREKRDTAKRVIEAGNDPVQKRSLEKQKKVIDSENTFEVIALEWYEQQRERWKQHHAVDVLNSIKREVFPALGKRPLIDITTQEVLSVIRKIENRGALDVAGRILQRTTSVFRYAVQTGRLTANPATELRGAVKQRKVKHQPSLKADDLPEFLNKLELYEGEPLTRLALKLLLLTFVRPGELRFAEWGEINFKENLWTIPAGRMKMGAEHLVPLSRQAIATLEEIRPFSGHRGYVFPSRNREGKVMSENTMTYALYRLGYHSRAVPHGFRSTASTILNEQGWRPDVVERQLAHAEKNTVRAAYHRSEYLPDRTKMMQHWADYLDEVRAK
jgi:integrase